MTTKNFPCTQCGAKLEYAPGQLALVCPYCEHKNNIVDDASDTPAAIAELSYQEYLANQAGNEPTIQQQNVECPGCGAHTLFAPNVVADRCLFCASPMNAKAAIAVRLIQPKAVAPFDITETDARTRFKQWIKGLWFAPNALQKAYRSEQGLKGIYIPYWTYDADTDTQYSGQRGVDYTETETYVENGESKTRQVRKTDWSYVSGQVQLAFDDVLSIASNTLPTEYAEKLEPWQLGKLQSYRDDYVSGFTVEAYQVGLAPGFEHARGKMEDQIRSAICADIGGDHQVITAMQPRYKHIRFKHILLPIWLSSYKYGEKTYRFLINGQSGEVQGQRPYSAWKIAFVIVLGAIALGLAIMFAQR